MVVFVFILYRRAFTSWLDFVHSRTLLFNYGHTEHNPWDICFLDGYTLKKQKLMKRLKDKTAVITGGSGGIGAATAKMMIREGAKVLITDLDEEALKEVADEIDSPDLHWIAADVSDEEQVKKYADKAKELFGHVDVFLNNAGIEGEVKPLDEYPMDVFRKIVDVNIYGVYYGLRYIFPLMKEHGGFRDHHLITGRYPRACQHVAIRDQQARQFRHDAHRRPGRRTV